MGMVSTYYVYRQLKIRKPVKLFENERILLSSFGAHDIWVILKLNFYQLLEEFFFSTLHFLSQKINEIIATKQDGPVTKKQQATCTEFSRTFMKRRDSLQQLSTKPQSFPTSWVHLHQVEIKLKKTWHQPRTLGSHLVPVSSLQGHAQTLEHLGQWKFCSQTALSKEEGQLEPHRRELSFCASKKGSQFLTVNRNHYSEGLNMNKIGQEIRYIYNWQSYIPAFESRPKPHLSKWKVIVQPIMNPRALQTCQHSKFNCNQSQQIAL